MGRPYSLDLRQRVVAAIRAGMSCRDAAKHYQVGESSAIRWARRDRETGSPAALPMGGKRPFALEDQRDWLLERLAAEPGITLRALLAELHARDVDVSYYAVWNYLDRTGIGARRRPARPRAAKVNMPNPAGPNPSGPNPAGRPEPGEAAAPACLAPPDCC